MKVVTVVGARPQFVKAAPVSRALAAAGVAEYLVHTGQHYDDAMSAVFFRELSIREPDVNLEIGSGGHAVQTAGMMSGLDPVLASEAPDCVLVYGDTNSTLAGALTAAKRGIPVAHVEAGLRSFDRGMPEEINRVVTDHVSALLFAPTDVAVANLAREGIVAGVHRTGDVMFDAIRESLPRARTGDSAAARLGLAPRTYAVATVHRAANTGTREDLHAVLACLGAVAMPVLFPVHPRTQEALGRVGLALPANVVPVAPLSYLAMLRVMAEAHVILTDSGGVQKEAFWLGVPCITLREETEWTETVASGWNTLVGADPVRTAAALAQPAPDPAARPEPEGGSAAAVVVRTLVDVLAAGGR